MIAPIRWADDRLLLLDQTLLPVEERFREYSRWPDVAEAIRTLVVRGAPAIGCTAAFGLVLAARQSLAEDTEGILRDLEEAEKGLASTRPTAVNLFWALDRMRGVAHAERARPVPAFRARLLAEGPGHSSRRMSRETGPWAPTALPSFPKGRAFSPTAMPERSPPAGYGTAVGVIRAAS
jgi:methylthioribose-1-phosphate isomerase